jgi:hypothetical protein
LDAHLQSFARWTKEAGTAGELESLRHVRAEMDTFGYATELLFHDAYISLPGKARIEAGGEVFDCITQSFSRSSDPAGVAGRGVALGLGSAADFAGAELRGAIVVVDGIATPQVAERTGASGAVGQIHVCPGENIHEMCISPVWGSPSHQNLDQLPSTVVVSVARSVGERIRALVLSDPDLELRLFAEVDTGWRKTPILVAELAGPDSDTAPFVMFSGHHDTWHYGVMDNGGANATMMEVARICALHRAHWLRGLRVIFWSGHSQGRYSGSSWYADTYWDELQRRAVAHVNIDSTGAKGNVVLYDAQADPELGDLAREAIAVQGGQEFGGHIVARAGDQSFWGIGIPSIFAALGEQPASDAPVAATMLFGGPGRKGAGTGWWWHTPEDTYDKMDLDIAVRDTRVYLHVVWKLLAERLLPIDHRAVVSALLSRLELDHERLGTRCNLDLPTARARALQQALERLASLAQAECPDVAIARINAAILEMSHALVPVQHVTGDRYIPDPAVGLPTFASLRDLDLLAQSAPGSDQEKFIIVAARRAINRLAQSLLEANRAVQACLDDLGDAALERSPPVGGN